MSPDIFDTPTADTADLYKSAITKSIQSIAMDSTLSPEDRAAMIEQSLAQYHDRMLELTKADDTPPQENPISKSDPNRFDEVVEVDKFNPYHDAKGRFASANGYASFTIRTRDPGKQHMADMAVAREKERNAAAEAAEAAKKPKSVEFTPAKTKKAAVEYAKKELGFTNVSYGTKLDIDTINHINEEITKIQAAQPMVKGTVSTLKTTTSQRVYAQIALSADGSMSFEIGSHLYGKGLDALKQSYDNDVKSGYHPKGTDYRSIIYHEYGHVMAAISSKNRLGVGAKDGIEFGGRMNYMTSLRGHKVEKEWLFEAAQKTGQKPSEMMKSISRYAQKNPGETFAEAYAEFMCSPNPSENAVAIVTASGWHR